MFLSNREKKIPHNIHCREQPIEKMEQKLSYLNEVDEMIVLVVRTDGGEELFERSLLSGGELPACHVKS